MSARVVGFLPRLLAAVALAGPLTAQAQIVTDSDHGGEPMAAAFAAYMSVLVADSMRGPTPSAALNRAARYVASEFRAQKLLLHPDSSTTAPGRWTRGDRAAVPTWKSDADGIQYYPIPRQFRADYSKAALSFYFQLHRGGHQILTETGNPVFRSMALDFTKGARLVSRAVRDPVYRFEAPPVGVLLAGPQSLASLRQMDLQRKIVVYVPPLSEDTATRNLVIRELA